MYYKRKQDPKETESYTNDAYQLFSEELEEHWLEDYIFWLNNSKEDFLKLLKVKPEDIVWPDAKDMVRDWIDEQLDMGNIDTLSDDDYDHMFEEEREQNAYWDYVNSKTDAMLGK